MQLEAIHYAGIVAILLSSLQVGCSHTEDGIGPLEVGEGEGAASEGEPMAEDGQVTSGALSLSFQAPVYPDLRCDISIVSSRVAIGQSSECTISLVNTGSSRIELPGDLWGNIRYYHPVSDDFTQMGLLASATPPDSMWLEPGESTQRSFRIVTQEDSLYLDPNERTYRDGLALLIEAVGECDLRINVFGKSVALPIVVNEPNRAVQTDPAHEIEDD